MGRLLRVGGPVPEFSAAASDGSTRSRSAMLGRPYVLAFYPADFTPGCTTQMCAMRDELASFRSLGVEVLGVSRDSVETHAAWVERQGLTFPLLADVDGEMHAAFGATMLGGLPRRVSYLVDADGRVAAVFDSHLRPAAHAPRMLAAARKLARR